MTEKREQMDCCARAPMYAVETAAVVRASRHADVYNSHQQGADGLCVGRRSDELSQSNASRSSGGDRRAGVLDVSRQPAAEHAERGRTGECVVAVSNRTHKVAVQFSVGHACVEFGRCACRGRLYVQSGGRRFSQTRKEQAALVTRVVLRKVHTRLV